MRSILALVWMCAWMPGSPGHAVDPSEPMVSTEIADAFLSEVCASDMDFPAAWLRHEEAHWDLYGPAYYRSSAAMAARADLAAAMAGRREEMCKLARAFTLVAPAVMRSLAPRVADLLGVEPRLKLVLAAPLQWTDASGADIRGEKVYIFNARHDTFARTVGMAATIAHELVHSALAGREAGLPASLPLSLYHEGMAVFATQVMFPEVGPGATGLKPDELAAAERTQAAAARALLDLWARTPGSEDLARFFSGAWSGPEHPRKMGYFLGLKTFQRIERDLGTAAALRLQPSEFSVRAKTILIDLAAGR